MAINLMDAGEPDADVNSTINTTPLVDVMLVMLIIFLITVPVVIKSVPVNLPVAKNIVLVTKPQDITIAVDKNGNVYWNDQPVMSNDDLLDRLKMVSVQVPQPEVHIRGDRNVRFEYIGKVILDLQRTAIQKVGFITNPIQPNNL